MGVEAAGKLDVTAGVEMEREAREEPVSEETWEAAWQYEAGRGVMKNAAEVGEGSDGEERYGALGDPYEEEQDAEELARKGQADMHKDGDVELEDQEEEDAKLRVPDIDWPEQRPLGELARLVDVREELLEADFNAFVQPMLDESAPTPREQSERGEALKVIVYFFNVVAQRVGEFVVEMLRTEPETWPLKPIGKGMAGGLKFRVGKLLVKVPLAKGKAARYYGNDQLMVHKAGQCELRAFASLMKQNIPGIHVPLMVAAEAYGLEAYVMSVLPIDEQSLKIGSNNAGHTLQCATEGVAAHAAQLLGVALHLKPHRVCEGSTGEEKVMPLAGDVEVHESPDDGRAYLLDAGRLLPPTSSGNVGGALLPLVHQFRPEFMASLPRGRIAALSPDGFLNWGRLDCEEHHAELEAAWQMVLELAGQVARRAVEGDPVALLTPEEDGTRPLAAAFHAEGVNMRTLLVARASVDDATGRQVLLLECVYRAVKHMVRRRSVNRTGEVDDMMEELLEQLQDEGFWLGELCRVVERLFVAHVREVPEAVHEQFEADKRSLADDLAELAVDEALAQVLLASLARGVAGVQRGEDGQWRVVPRVTRVQLPAYGDVQSAVRRLEVEIEARKQMMGEHSLEALRLQTQMLNVFKHFVEEDPATTRAKAGAMIAEIEASAGEDHERTFAIQQAAIFLDHVGEYSKALELYERALHIDEAALGPEHPSVGDTLNNIAVVHRAQGEYSKALKLFERALAISKAALGPKHLSVGETLSNMAGVYQLQGEYSKALEVYERALRIKEAALGPEHPSVGDTLNNMANVQQAQGKYSNALELYERNLRIAKAALGPAHPSVGEVLSNMAELYKAQGEYSKALELFERALAISKAALGPKHPSVGDTLSNMAIVFQLQGKYSKALVLHERASRIKGAALGPEHPSVGQALNNMANVYELQREYSKALQLYERALRICEAALGPAHPSVGEILSNMAGVYHALGESSKALELFERALRICEAALGPEHPSVGKTLCNLAVVYEAHAEYRKALEVCERALRIRTAALGPGHPSVGISHHNMAGLLLQTAAVLQAKTHSERALVIFRASFPAGHTYISVAEQRLHEIEVACAASEE